MVMERMTKIIDGRLVFPSELVGVMMTPSNDTMCRILNRLAAYEDTGLEPGEIKNALDVNDIIPKINVTVDHIRDLLQAEQAGQLVILPCKVGDTVYAAETSPVIPLSVAYVGVYLDGTDGGDWEALENIGKTVFLTREEAEAALAGKGGAK